MNDGVFSEWNGQRPLYVVPARFSGTYSCTTCTMFGLQAEVVDELLRERAPSVLQLHDRDAAAALFSGGAVANSRPADAAAESPRQRALQLTGAVAVNEPDASLIGQQRLVEKPLGARQRFVDRAADDVQIGRRAARAAAARR